HPQPGTVKRPLIESYESALTGPGLVATAEFDPASDPFLIDHLMQGKPFLPAAVNVEALAEAAALARPGLAVVRLRDVEILHGLRFYSERPQSARIHVAINEQGAATCRITSDFSDRKG